MGNPQRCVAPLQLGGGHRGASGRGLRSAPRSSAARIALRSQEDGGRGDRVDKAAASERDLAFYEELMSCSGDAELEAGIRSALSVLGDALRLYGHERCRVSFNGGKDADVILHLMRAALAMGVPVATVIGGGYDADHECAPSPLPAHGASAAIASPAGALLDL